MISLEFSPIWVTSSVTKPANSLKFSTNLVTFSSTKFSLNLVTVSSPKFSPVFTIHPNFRQSLRKFCRKIKRKSVSSLSSKDFTLKSFRTVPHLKTIEVSIAAFIMEQISTKPLIPILSYFQRKWKWENEWLETQIY